MFVNARPRPICQGPGPCSDVHHLGHSIKITELNWTEGQHYVRKHIVKAIYPKHTRHTASPRS